MALAGHAKPAAKSVSGDYARGLSLGEPSFSYVLMGWREVPLICGI
jgi:hypothetical protein